MRKFIFILTIFLLANSCSTEQQDPNASSSQKKAVNIRLKASPDRLMPLLSKSSYASVIESYLYSSLYLYDEATGRMVPYLSEGDVSISRDSNFTFYTYQIKDKAVWDDGSPVQAEDFLFTLKWALNPFIQGSGIQSYVSLIDSVQLYSDNNKKFTVWMNESYILAEEAIGMLPIIQKDSMDPKSLLDQVNLSQIGQLDQKNIEEISSYFTNLAASSYGRDKISGTGPYQLSDWQTDRYVSLERKKDWWGDNLELTMLPDKKIQKINFVIVPDESVARAMFNKGELDILTSVSPNTYNEMKKDLVDSAQFFHPLTSKFYILSINNNDKLLRHRDVRKAINALIDQEQLIELQLQGRAEAIYGPIHPSAPYAISTSHPESGIATASHILDSAGWSDLDGDGIRQKMIEGKNVELKTSIQVSSGKLGQLIALTLKENAAKVGLIVDIQSSDFSIIRSKMNDRTYTMTPLVIKTSGMLYDPYQTWHSDNAVPGKNNFSSYQNHTVDSIIDKLRMELNDDRRNDYYRAFQLQVIKDFPVIFLAAPEELIISKNNIEIKTHSIAPGYYLQSIR